MGWGARFYKMLPYIRSIIVILELMSATTVLYVITVAVFIPVSPTTNTTTTGRSTTTVRSTTTTAATTQVNQTKLIIGIALSFAGSFVAILTAVLCGINSIFCCVCLIVKKWRRPFLRFMLLNCNCPCYIARPRLRFTIRICITLVSVLLRVAGTVFFGITKDELGTETEKTYRKILLITSAASLIFPIFLFLLDVYHYRIWWAYKPEVNIGSLSIGTSLSHKHRRFIPYVLIENFHNLAYSKHSLCKNGNECQSRRLEHIVIFHSMDFRPQQRWSPKYPNYIGFHRTKAESAMAIAHSDLRISQTPPQMLGFGIYFARSAASTEGKARETGAYICAKIRMGRVLTVTFSELKNVQNSKEWWNNYDTVYYTHQNEEKDEFCVKSPDQVLKWIIYVESEKDYRLSQYGMDKEYDDTVCHCI